MPARPRAVSVSAGPSDVAGLAVYHGSVAAAARAIGVSRGALDGIISGRHGMGSKVQAAVAAHLNDRSALSQADAKLAKDIGRVVTFTSSGEPKRIRSEIQRLKVYDEKNKRKEVSFYVARQKELAGRDPRDGLGGGGGGGGGGPAPGEESSDEEWYAEYGAWVEEVESWGGDVGELPDIEELPF